MTIVIPSYQPDERLLALVRSLSGVGFNIIVVDDASGREYRQYFDSLPHNALVLRHAQNFGKGAATHFSAGSVIPYAPVFPRSDRRQGWRHAKRPAGVSGVVDFVAAFQQRRRADIQRRVQLFA